MIKNLKLFIGIITLSLLIVNCKKKEVTDETPYTTVTDIDGNVYRTVTIGEQVWMAENLKTTKYYDGKEIPQVSDNDEWTNLNSPAYCWYDNDEATYKNQYGALYNWHVINSGNICPSGWHVPTDDEWTTLRDYIANDGHTRSRVAAALKSTTGWRDGGNGTDNYGFSALAAGYRLFNSGSYRDETENAYWWSATPDGDDFAWGRYIQFGGKILYVLSYDHKNGVSVRCLQDD